MAQKTQNNLLRVTQMNAVYLDKEIIKCLQEAIHDALKYLPVGYCLSVNFEVMYQSFFYVSLDLQHF